MKPLTEKRMRVLEQIGRSQRAGEFLLVRELAAELGLAGESSLRSLLDPLVRDGYLIKHGGGRARHDCRYTLSPKAEQLVPDVSQRLLVPHLGRVTAGLLKEVVQECDKFVDVGNLLQAQPGDFMLDAVGDSMIGDGILDGDSVLIRPGVPVNNNQIAVVQIERENGAYESTLKRVRFQPGRKTVTLRASNPKYDDIVLAAGQVEVVGVYRGLLRRLKSKQD